MSDEKEEPKLIIDEDWKAQVQREKEEFAAKEAADKEASDPSRTDPGQDQSTGELPPPPPATFEMLITMLASQALMSLGQVPNPATGKAEANKPYAKHYIDTIDMLVDKTKGNLSPEEEAAVTQTLHQLRMLFVSS